MTEKNSAADRLQKWALYGYERSREDQLQAAKLAASEEIANDRERTERIRAAAHRSAEDHTVVDAIVPVLLADDDELLRDAGAWPPFIAWMRVQSA